MDEEQIFAKLAKLNVDRASGIAPHKPLLLLVLIELAKHGQLDSPNVKLTADLAYRFSIYWTIIAHRRTQPPDVRLPFFHLHTSKLWTTHLADGTASKHREDTKSICLATEFFTSLQSESFREQAAYLLISNYFEPAEQVALYEMSGYSPPENADFLNELTVATDKAARAEGRSARFRVDVVAAYCHTCALTGYRITTLSGYCIVDAAHIHAFADSRNDDPQNGIALCKNAHWLFDHGFWAIDDDYTVKIATADFEESCPAQQSLRSFAGKTLLLPRRQEYWPSEKNIRWHRKHVFEKKISQD